MKCPRTHCPFTPCPRIPRTESLVTSARSTCTAGSRARLPGVCFRVVLAQEPQRQPVTGCAARGGDCGGICVDSEHNSDTGGEVRDVARALPPVRPTECCAQVPCRARVEAHVLVAVAARRLRVRKHSVPLSSDRGSAAATVTRPSRRVPSTVPPCPASPTPPLDRIGVGSTPATIYPRALAQHFSCQWRCNRPDVLLLQTALQQPAPW